MPSEASAPTEPAECDRCGADETTANTVYCEPCRDDLLGDDVCEVCGTWLGSGYRCSDCDDVIVHRLHNPADPIDGFTFYFGAASGSSRKALRELQEPNVMLNYATKLNQPWWGIERLFIDSGGYSFMKGKGEYETSDAEYLAFVEEHEPERFALRDYPCEPDVLEEHGRTVAEHQRKTTERHRALLEALSEFDLDAEPVAVIQGRAVEDYLEHADALRDAGLLTDYVGIGSVCRRNAADEIREVVLAVRDALPASIDLHAFGVKGSVLQYPDVRDALASADSQSYEKQAQWGALKEIGAGEKNWQDSALEYLSQKRRLRAALAGKNDADTRQGTLPGTATATDGGEALGE